jgi:hypothetical protein
MILKLHDCPQTERINAFAMKPEYPQTRFLVEKIKSLPPRFGVVTACNPNGVHVDDEKNKAATERLRNHLESAGYNFFRVTGCSPDFRHQEPGFGIICQDRDKIVEMGRAWHQEAIFWIENGTVHLVPCGGGDPVCLGEWSAMAQPEGWSISGK